MLMWLVAAGAVFLGGIAESQEQVPLTAGMVIDRSIVVRPGTYRLAASADMKAPAITIRGQNITVDFNNAVLAGGPDFADPDTYAGVGIFIDGGSTVTVKNATVRGYKVAILARRSPGLHLTGNDLSYNWKQRLYSGIERESLVDWMSYHQNEKDEWLRFGAAIYLSECDRAEIDHNTAVQGQNGLMVTRSTGLKIWNNTFQFLSSLGIGFYRVTRSTVMHNRIDWCVRGYSHGYYNRGQDSAGLLMYEQSSDNTVAYNSITHGGDGLFLWAGQSTMDTGQGGANDNLFYANDFSHAPTNGIETTFSRNRFIENRVEDCWHGVWGGYSFSSVWHGNRFARNAEAVAIEHGQDNEISGNTFDGDATAIRLWQNATQDPSWGYAKARDTRSREYRIEQNTFNDHAIALDIRDTAQVRLWANHYNAVGERLKLTGQTPGVHELKEMPEVLMIHDSELPDRLPEGMDAMLRSGTGRGRETIVVDEWGPYDWKSPKLWPVLEADGSKPLPYAPPPASNVTARTSRLRVLGPAGEWKVVSARGATVSARAGKVGDEITVTPPGSGAIDWTVTLEYRGGAVISPRGAKTPAGQPYRFAYSRFFVPIGWRIQLFEYAEPSDPVKQPKGFAMLMAGTPAKTVTRDRLDYVSGRAIEEGLARDRFALRAEGLARLPDGEHTLQVISDDGVRVWVDDRLILDGWEPHESRVDRVTIPGGARRFRVEYYEVGGFAELRLDIQRK